MSQLLAGKKGVIFGALDENSIAWKVAEKAIAHGAQIILTNAPVALRLGTIKDMASKLNVPLIPADATKNEDLENLFTQASQHFGGKIDFVLHSIGMSINVRKSRHYTDLVHEDFIKAMDISALSYHRVMQTLYNKDLMNHQGSILCLSYIAAQRTFPGYSDMADNKSMLESITRSFGYYFGKKNGTRVNSISQSPTKTTAGSGIKGFDAFYNFAQAMSPLGNATAEECADYCITLFSDLTRKVTMQNLFHDGGFSFTGVSEEVMESFLDK
ncbi:MAG: SDR family oxidoreductase [Chitinophagales bacterium]|jgi:enoyl-[acyl-carrier protein] reductase I|nr:SDR family oxidoreductase [Chitinophagales bacterium]